MYAQVMKSSDAAKKAWATRKAKAGGGTSSDTGTAKPKAAAKPAPVTSKKPAPTAALDKAPAPSKAKPAFASHVKITHDQAKEAMVKRGYSMGTPKFDMKAGKTMIPITDKKGNTRTVSAKEIDSFLKGKSAL